jgi:ArsR family transcriptional regulator
MALSTPLAALDFAPADAAWQSLGAITKAVGDPLRLQILRVLSGDSFSVSELCDVFELRQSALSHHLKVLVNADWLTRRREGTAIYYRRQLPRGEDAPLRDAVIASIDLRPLPQALIDRLADVQKARENNSLAFFRDNAERFREQQELIASWEEYSAASLHILDTAGLAKKSTLLEIGPGDGRLLPALAERAERVIALDNSPAMLNRAREQSADHPQIDFLLGDTSVALADGVRADGVIMNMVLHHTPDPRGVLAEASQLLNHDGVIVISELCAHDQGWAREHCGDLWLGFDADELADWAASAGLSHRGRLFIAQRNGFQIQVQLFQRTQDLKGIEA